MADVDGVQTKFDQKKLQVIYPACPGKCTKCTENPMHSLSDMWSCDWSRFESGKVSSIIRDKRSSIVHYTYYKVDPKSGLVSSVHADDINDVPMQYRDNVDIKVNFFYGFAKVNGQTIHLSSTGYNELDFDEKITGTFGKNYHFQQDVYLPRKGDFVIGSVGYRPDGRKHFKRWFVASPEFHQLWSYVVGLSKEPKNLRTMPWEQLIKLPNSTEHGLSLVTRRYQRSYWAWVEIYRSLLSIHRGRFDQVNKKLLPPDFLHSFASKTFERCSERETRKKHMPKTDPTREAISRDSGAMLFSRRMKRPTQVPLVAQVPLALSL